MTTLFIAGGEVCVPGGGRIFHRISIAQCQTQRADDEIVSALDDIYEVLKYGPPGPHTAKWALAGEVQNHAGVLRHAQNLLAELPGVTQLAGGALFEDGLPGRPGHGALSEAKCGEVLRRALSDAALLRGGAGAPAAPVRAVLPLPGGYAPPTAAATPSQGAAQAAAAACEPPAGRPAGSLAGADQEADRSGPPHRAGSTQQDERGAAGSLASTQKQDGGAEEGGGWETVGEVRVEA